MSREGDRAPADRSASIDLIIAVVRRPTWSHKYRLLKVVTRFAELTILASLPVFLLSNPSLACRGSRSLRAVLLETVPVEAQSEPVIARVVIKDFYTKDFDYNGNTLSYGYAKAEVIQPIKGAKAGQIITISTSQTFCDTMLTKGDVGRDGFVAGKFAFGDSIYDLAIKGFWDRRYERKR